MPYGRVFSSFKVRFRGYCIRSEKNKFIRDNKKKYNFVFSEIQRLKINPVINIGENDVYFISDEKILNRILSNLIINIIKHGVDATELGIDLKEEDRFVLLSVWDNGIGISSDEIDHIFDRLYTVEKSRSTSLKNSGLGLTIVKKLVESLDGSITVQSKQYEKTIFNIKLPKMRNLKS